MFELYGKFTNAKIFATTVEAEAIAQIQNMINQPVAEDSQVRIMADTHAGAGCTIGTTMTIDDRVCPNLVGVDIGCLDKDTEVLTPDGWIKISDYNNQEILMYNVAHDTAHFDMPIAYIKNPCSEFYHLHHSKGLDQMISEEHKIVIWRGYKSRGYNKVIHNAKAIIEQHNKSPKSNRYIKTTFHTTENGLTLTDNQIRLLVMIAADGCIKHIGKTQQRIELHFRKTRKIDRAKNLLNANKIKFNEYKASDNTTYIDFHTDKSVSKSLRQFFRASHHQLKILTDEIYHWDGTIDHKRHHKNFFSSDKMNADVIQYAFHATGIRTGIHVLKYPDHPNWNTSYQVYETKNEYVGFPTEPIHKVPSTDGWKYCFTTKTGFFIIRRNNNISITGNCGMLTVQLKEKADEIDFAALDNAIRRLVPSGRNVHTEIRPGATRFRAKNLKCFGRPGAGISEDKAFQSVGTLGGGELIASGKVNSLS